MVMRTEIMDMDIREIMTVTGNESHSDEQDTKEASLNRFGRQSLTGGNLITATDGGKTDFMATLPPSFCFAFSQTGWIFRVPEQ